MHTWEARPYDSPESLVELIDREGDAVREALLTHGAIRFADAGVDSVERFAQVRDAVLPSTTPYVEAATPRRDLGREVFSSTEFPASEEIALHNENSYATSWPGELLFCCLVPAESGGATPLADVRRVLARLPDSLLREFERRGWMLIRNYGDGFGLPWQEAFASERESDVARYCEAADVACEWLPGGRLRTRQVRPALARHPRTGERLWFNHVRFWHPSSLAPETREMLTEELGDDGLPYDVRYGDGGAIPDAVVAEIAAAYEVEKEALPWGGGDVFLVDNMLVAHGREPFTGERRVLVSLGRTRERVECLA